MSSSSSDSGASEQVTIPNVFKMKKEQAIAELRRAGVRGDIDEDTSLCGSLVDGRVVEQGEVCYQHPPGGRVQGSRLVVSIRVQTENPWHGNIGTHNEWRLMPKVIGMTIDQARAEMLRVGFQREDRVQLVIADESECKPNIVCRQYPDPLDRAGINDGKIVYVGRDPNERRPTTDEAKPETAAEAPRMDSVRTDLPRSDSTSAPKPEPAPEPFFTVSSEPAPRPRPEPATASSSTGPSATSSTGETHPASCSDSVDADTFRVKGWSGPIAIDTARVIVETKKAAE